MGQRFIELASDPEVRSHRIRAFLKAWRERPVRLPEKFGVFICFSLLSHLILFGILLVMGYAQNSKPTAIFQSNLRAYSRALMEIEREAGRVPLSESPSSPKALDDLGEDIGSLFRFEKDISEQDKVRFFRSILESGKILDTGGRLEMATGAFFVTKSASGDAYEVNKVDRATLDKIDQLNESRNMSPTEDQPGGDPEKNRTEHGPTEVPGEYLYRESPYAEILARGPRLFTVFNGFPDLAGERQAPSAGDRSDAAPIRAGALSSQSGIIFLTTRSPSANAEGDRAVLRLSPEERGRILDELMVLMEPEQLDAFKGRYLDAYDPDRGDLAPLTREFCYSNLNSVFIVTDLVTSTFDAIEGIHFKRPVYDFYAAYGRRLFKSKTGGALLLNLAFSYDFERRTLNALFDAHDDARRVMAGAQEVPGKYQPRLKAYVINQLYQEVSDLGGRMGLSPEDLSGLYVRRQEEIYELLADLGGEAGNRALYAWGRLDWERERFEAATEKWKRADMSYPLSSRAFRRIREMIDRYDITTSVTALKDVDRILGNEDVYDKQNLLDRHLKFNTWKKRAG